MTIKLIAGLGNPGTEYEHSRHNIGFDLLSEIANKYKIILRNDSKYNAIIGKGYIKDNEIKVIFPQTYMNKSGESVGPYANFFKYTPDEILVIHDELDLPPGTAKLKLGGGHGGHNGLKSIIASLGNNANFHRLRVGIGKPNTREEMINFVLGNPPVSERMLIEKAMDEALACIDLIFSQNIAKATNRLNSFKAQNKDL
ncbi:MAG: aminoacyl-tRNA hydrolase [Succinivibrionaceae bacterium]